MEIVVITWLDVSKTTNDDGSFDSSKNIDERLCKMKTIGWLYRESDTVVLLVQEFLEGQPRDFVTIPKSLIVSRVIIGRSD
jgi:hypothetical protein